jgi:hypothetical protein
MFRADKELPREDAFVVADFYAKFDAAKREELKKQH